MATLGIESNGLLEKTAIYYNGQQLSGVKEIFLNLDEDGTFDAIIQYEGKDKDIYTKQVFSNYLTNVKMVPPAFTEEEASELELLAVESEGDIDTAMVFFNEEPLEGVVSLFVHIKSAPGDKDSLKTLFTGKDKLSDEPEFRAEITFRNEDDSIETEDVF